jgi:HEPN domain-containing protein
MSKKPLEFAAQWLQKAKNDLFTADTLLEKEESPVDSIAFHSQQAVEKSLKGLLTAKSVRFQRTHDLNELSVLAEGFLPDLKAWRQKFSMLTQFAVDVRYPEAIEEPSRAEVMQARDDAWVIFRMVKSFIRMGHEDETPRERERHE